MIEKTFTGSLKLGVTTLNGKFYVEIIRVATDDGVNFSEDHIISPPYDTEEMATARMNDVVAGLVKEKGFRLNKEEWVQ